MLGHGALGQIALGQLLILPVSLSMRPGSGAGHRRFDFVPGPPYEVKPAKPFRPVWDRRRQAEIEELRTAEIAPQSTPLPPASIFAQPPTPQSISGVPPFGLPDFNNLVPPDPMGLAQRAKEATDMNDVFDALAALSALDTTGTKAN